MNNILLIDAPTPIDIARQIADRVRKRRLELNLTREGLAARAGVNFYTFRRFEQTGEISLLGLLRVAFALGCLEDFSELFACQQYSSIDEMLAAQTTVRRRGRKK